ncbi:MAG: DNA replication/repair protein RecF [Alphaproteobacteria bacterium]|nr:DNA replication/repair protein RecF [Alphaproteobacteria bacterium]
MTYRINRLTLSDFRNYATLRIEPTCPLVALTGNNGAGKTNILEAVSLLVPGRGLRGSAFNVVARLSGSGSWAVAATVDVPEGEFHLGTSFEGDPSSEDGGNAGRNAMVDGEVQRSSGVLTNYLKMLWLTPAMDRLFAGPASDRRRFFDRLVAAFDSHHGARFSAFEKLMRERNFLLQDHRSDAVWLSSIERQMAEQAVAIATARNAAAETLARHFAGHADQSPFPWGILQLVGEIEVLAAHNPAVQAEEEYARLLFDSRGADRAQQRTLKGPHRTDFSVTHGPKNVPADLCSTGEQKALLIGLILAQAKAVKELVGAAPILLLDEVAAHLDAARRRGLFESLTRLGVQAWMTGTDESLFGEAGPQAALYHVEQGEIVEVKQ